MDSFESTLFGLLAGLDGITRGEVIGNTQVGEYTIDTCNTIDQGWETAICKGSGEWIVVARYPNKTEAEQGHADWAQVCSLNPTKAWSVQLDEYVEF